MKSSIVFAAVVCIGSVAARSEFRSRVPNAHNVVDVEAIGHVDPEGGGPRNSFGLDFAAAGLRWTKELCEKDSDGDGQTNGQELGDPCCTWVKDTNETVAWTTGMSAPGDAKKKSDPTLWASISCAGGSSSNVATEKSKSTTSTPSPTVKSGVANVATLACTASAVTLLTTLLV